MKRIAKVLKPFVLQFSGLKTGVHHFDVQIDDTFLEAFEWEEASEIQADLQVQMDKQDTMLTLNLALRGTITLPCDRCGGPMQIPVDADHQLYVKFGHEAYEETDEILVLPEGAYEIDVSQLAYEYLRLSIPMRKVHPEGECDPAVVQHLSAGEAPEPEPEEEPEIDPRWAALKNLNPDNDNKETE